jgi:hypothetical protein
VLPSGGLEARLAGEPGPEQHLSSFVIRHPSELGALPGAERGPGGRPASFPRPAAAPVQPAYSPPAGAWQDQARQAIELCEQALWAEAGRAAREYLHGRGLHDETLHIWRLGYSTGFRLGELWVARGVLVPCIVKGTIWYLKIALLPGDPLKCERCGERALARQACPKCGALNKYRGVKGNRTAAIYGAEELIGASTALFVEGEFDALIAWQALRDVLGVCTLGSAANRLDLATWGPYLLSLERILAAYDSDRAGQAGAQALAGLSERVRPCPLPEGVKDVNDLALNGGDLWACVKIGLEAYGI